MGYDDWILSRTTFKPRKNVKNYIYRGRKHDTIYVKSLFLSNNPMCDGLLGERIVCEKFGKFLIERHMAISIETMVAMNFILDQKDIPKDETRYQSLKIKKHGNMEHRMGVGLSARPCTG